MTSNVPKWRLNAPPGTSLAEARRLSGQTAAVLAAAPPAGLERILRPQVRRQWLLPSLQYLTPAYVETLLRNGLAGDHVAQHDLFALMEDTWPRLRKNLVEIKRAVQRLDWKLVPWAEEDDAPNESAKEKAKLVSHAVWRMRPTTAESENDFLGTVFDIMDAWAKGLSVLEVIWERRSAGKLGEITTPHGTAWVDPRFYGYGQDGYLGLRREVARWGQGMAATEVDQFPEHQFIVSVCKSASGDILGGALLRPLAWWWCASNFSAGWLLNLGEIFGLPIRWATYAEGASQETIELISEMLEQMGASGWAAFPAGTTLELKESTKAATQYPQVEILDRADRQCDLLILGQTLTSDVGDSGSRALGDVHADVREDVILAAGEFVAAVLNRQLIPSILALNYGDAEEAPEFCPEPRRQEDYKANAERDAILLDRGVPMPRDWFFARHNIPIPQEGEPVVTAGPAREPAAAPDPEPDPESEAGRAVEAASAQEKLADAVAEDVTGVEAVWLRGARPWFRRLIDAAQNPRITDEEFVSIVDRARKNVPEELAPALVPEAIAASLEAAMGAACVNGAITGYLARRPKEGA